MRILAHANQGTEPRWLCLRAKKRASEKRARKESFNRLAHRQTPSRRMVAALRRSPLARG